MGYVRECEIYKTAWKEGARGEDSRKPEVRNSRDLLEKMTPPAGPSFFGRQKANRQYLLYLAGGEAHTRVFADSGICGSRGDFGNKWGEDNENTGENLGADPPEEDGGNPENDA